jgi:hypothetical protein
MRVDQLPPGVHHSSLLRIHIITKFRNSGPIPDNNNKAIHIIIGSISELIKTKSVFKRKYTKEVKMVCKICLAEVKCEATRLGRLSSPGHRQKSIAASSYNNNTSFITLYCPKSIAASSYNNNVQFCSRY